jgi:pimeloyl-ACP methyl ester carboxylesterase
MSRLRWTAIALAPTLALGLSLGLDPAAQAGEPSTGAAQATSLDRFTHQPLTWHSCQTDPQDADGAALDQAGATCTDVTVPLDYRHPDRRTITVALSRIAASDTAHRIGPMIINLGGPGIPVLTRVADAAAAMGATGARFDLIGMDPRFVGRSSPLDCGWPQSSIPRSNGTSPASVGRMLDLSHDLANRCTTNDRDLLPFASTADEARDMDLIRAALGAPRMSFLGYSYGTYLGAVYAQLFPDHAGRMVLDSAIDPADPGIHVRSDAGPAREAALHTWADWAAARDATYHLGTTGADVVALINRIDAAAAVQPLHVGAYDVDDTVVPALLLDPLIDDDDASQDQLARFVSQLAQALAGTPATPSADLDQALASILTAVNSAQHSEGTVISCADAPAPRSPSFYQRDAVQRRQEAPLFGGINRITPCAFWPFTPAGAVTIHNGIPALIVHADGDINATPELNQAMHQALTRSRLLTLTGVRTHGVYLFQGNPCIDDTVNAYLNTGTLPGQDATCTR